MAFLWALRIPFGVRNILFSLLKTYGLFRAFKNARVKTGGKETPLVVYLGYIA